MSESSAVCPNCGNMLQGRFCNACGQNQRSLRRAITPLMSDLIRESLGVDGRLWRTAYNLLFRPGQLSLDYVEGRRARYIAPMRLYLVVSILFFFVLSLQSSVGDAIGASALDIDQGDSSVEVAALMPLMDETHAAMVEEIVADPERTAARALIGELNESLAEQTRPPSTPQLFLMRQVVAVIHSPRDALSAMLESLPVVMFLLLPLFALVMKVVYLGSGRYYVEHLVFAVHLHTFSFIAYLPLVLLPEGPPEGDWTDTVESVAPLLVGIYHFIALRRFFAEGRVRTFFKWLVQLLIYVLVLIPITAVAIVMLTLLVV